MNTGQTVYEQLQEILNKCIELGWNYKFLSEHLECHTRGCIDFDREISYHELFSKDSGIMEFVEWKNIYYGDGYGNYKEWHYRNMSDITAEQKIQYFLENAIIPTK